MSSLAFAPVEPSDRIPPTDDGQFVTFSCGSVHYGVPVLAVREIRSWQPTTVIPGRAAAARGVLDMRGTVVEVFDLAVLLGGTPIEPTPGSVVLVLALADRVVGVLVDAVSDIIEVRVGDRMPLPPQDETSGGQVSFMASYEDRLIAILALSTLFD